MFPILYPLDFQYLEVVQKNLATDIIKIIKPTNIHQKATFTKIDCFIIKFDIEV